MGSTGRTDTGIPSTMPSKESLLDVVKKLKGKDLTDAIRRLDSFGDWYREDKRAKRRYLQEVIEGNYTNDPSESYDYLDAVDSNYKLIETVFGVNYYSDEFRNRFGYYDIDVLQKRNKKG